MKFLEICVEILVPKFGYPISFITVLFFLFQALNSISDLNQIKSELTNRP